MRSSTATPARRACANLERTVAELCRKAAKKMVDSGGKLKLVAIDRADIASYLGARKLIPEKIDDNDLVGVVNGLAYTEDGGDLLKVEAAVLDGTGKLELTGKLGDVMKESAEAALSFVRQVAPEYGIGTDFYKTKDIHIHVPEGAVPKDGPSAGVTMVTALVSALSHTPVAHDIAMTGEVTLTGRVLPIGGLREKTMAAYSAGVRTVLIPKANLGDLDDIDPEARGGAEIHPRFKREGGPRRSASRSRSRKACRGKAGRAHSDHSRDRRTKHSRSQRQWRLISTTFPLR